MCEDQDCFAIVFFILQAWVVFEYSIPQDFGGGNNEFNPLAVEVLQYGNTTPNRSRNNQAREPKGTRTDK